MEEDTITLTEAIAIVTGKISEGIPITGAKEELAKSFISQWAKSFGYQTAK